MAEERLNKLEEKLKHLLNDLEGDTGNDDWNTLDEKLNKRDATGSDAGLSALLSSLTGEVEEADWAAVADKLNNYDAAKKRKRAAYVGFSAAVLAGLIALMVVNPFADTSSKDDVTTVSEPTTKSENLTENNTEQRSAANDKANSTEPILEDEEVFNIGIPDLTGKGDQQTSGTTTLRNNSTADNGNNTTTQPENGNQEGGNVTNNNNQEKETNANNTTDKTDNNLADNTNNTNDNNGGVDKKEETTNTTEGDKKPEDVAVNNPDKKDETTPTTEPANTPKPQAKKQKKELAHNPLRNKITLGLFISPEYVVSSFRTNPGEDSWKVNKNYENINNDQRSSAFGFSTGFNFNYNPFKNFRVQAGVKYSETRENADYDFEMNEVIIIDNVGKQVYYYELPPGDEYRVKEAAVNKISYIEVPFMFGYNFNLGNSRWSIAPSVGGSYSKMLSASGIQLNETDLTVEKINYDELNKTNWTIQTSVGVYYQITNRLSFGVIPTYKTYLQTIETGNNYLKNRPYTIGINTGIRFSVF